MIGDNIYRRQDLLFKQDLWRPVVVIGLGGIGSWVGVELAKMGAKELWFFDPQTIEMHNTCYTIYGRHQAGFQERSGKKKVEALKRFLCRWEGGKKYGRDLKIKIFDRPPLEEDVFPALCIVVVAVDDMDVRRDIWENLVTLNPRVLWLIEARMGAEACMVYTVRPLDKEDDEFYSDERVLYPQSSASGETCAEQSFVYTSAVTGSIITSQVKKLLGQESYWSEIICDLKNMKFTTRRFIDLARPLCGAHLA